MEIRALRDFIENMPQELDTITKARYLYIELGKRSFYDANYRLMMFEEDDYNYKRKSYRNPNIIICTTLSKQLKELFELVGIKSDLLEDKNGHLQVTFEDEFKRLHLVDLTNDLKNIQFNCDTEFFCADSLPKQQRKDIDLSINYISEKRGYSDEYWHIVQDIISKSNLAKKAKFEMIINNMYKFGDLSKLGEIELFYLYQKFISCCAKESNLPVMYSSTRINSREQEHCISLITDSKTHQYILNKKTFMFEERIQSKEVLENEK